jgi:hypothetical protein
MGNTRRRAAAGGKNRPIPRKPADRSVSILPVGQSAKRVPSSKRTNGVAAMAERSKYQENIIKNYYKNFDGIQLQKLGEQITDLYLAEGKARAGLWKKIIVTLEKLKIPKTRIEHLEKADNPAMLAKLLEELLAKDAGAVK